MREIKLLEVTLRSIDVLLHHFAIVGMNSRENKIDRRLRFWTALKNSEGLVGPEDLAARHLPAEAARVAQLLGFSKIRFASADSFLRNLAVRDIYYRADDFVVAGFVSHAMCEIVKMLDRTIRHQQPMLVVKVVCASRRSLERVFDNAHVVRMRALQYQIWRRFRSGRVPVDPRRLVGPKYPLRACFHSDETSATEPLRVGQIRFPPPKLPFASLAFLDIE